MLSINIFRIKINYFKQILKINNSLNLEWNLRTKKLLTLPLRSKRKRSFLFSKFKIT